MKVTEDLIAERYEYDGLCTKRLNSVQLESLDTFLKDSLIKHQEISSCALCNSQDSILIAKKERHGIALRTVVCEDCGLVRSYDQLTEEGQRRFYEKYYRNIDENLQTYRQIIDDRYEQGGLNYIPPFVSKDDTVVEIGCGGGWNLVGFHKKGYKYFGFDYDESFIEFGKGKGLNLYLGGIDEADRMQIKADYLILNQVLEHVKNPVAFLERLKKYLTPMRLSIFGCRLWI